jgi:hypothetical protein
MRNRIAGNFSVSSSDFQNKIPGLRDLEFILLELLLEPYEFVLLLTCYNNYNPVVNFFATAAGSAGPQLIGHS